MADPEGKHDLATRVIAIEEWMMHTDQLLSSLNEVICSIQNRLDEQSRQIAWLKTRLEESRASDEEQRSFEDERPPHY
jgi:uncharacterized coiled-coil protein SlyX